MPLCEPGLLQLEGFMKEAGGGRREPSPLVLHEQLVEHTHAVNDDLEGRSGVWGEHSYARERGAVPHRHVRALLQPRTSPAAPPAPDSLVDVHTPPSPRPAPPSDRLTDSESDDADDVDWERTVSEAATTVTHHRLARVAVEMLTEMRLRRLAIEPRSRWRRAEAARGAAARLRRALATASAGETAWLHGTLLTYLPRSERTLYEMVVSELCRSAPRIMSRLVPRPPAPPSEPLDNAPSAVGSAAPGPWLGWVSAGCELQDLRWQRRLGALLHVRPLGGGAVEGPPERWGAARAHAVRSALSQLLHEAGSRAVVLGGCGAAATLAARLVNARGVRAVLLLAPPLITAEGPDEPLGEARVPALVVAGGAAATTWRGAAAEMAAGGGGARRLLLVAGADDALRLPRRHRLRLCVPQQALDAAIAEECGRWAMEVCAEEPESEGADKDVHSPGAGASPRESPPGKRSVEVVEGRVVSRVSGGTPLALRPPTSRRADLHAADIMRLPIVFADDLSGASAAAAPDAAEERLRVVAGGTRMTRVIVAKRATNPQRQT